jgi:hypothetical protein
MFFRVAPLAIMTIQLLLLTAVEPLRAQPTTRATNYNSKGFITHRLDNLSCQRQTRRPLGIHQR